jgi:hypothetical protein
MPWESRQKSQADPDSMCEKNNKIAKMKIKASFFMKHLNNIFD